MNQKLELSTPWVIYYRELEALFKEDPEVRVVYDEDAIEVKLYVENQDKADALTQLLPNEKEFGNITLKITVIPANKLSTDKVSLLKRAFRDNPALSFIAEHAVFGNSITYIVFKNAVVQYYTDNLGDVYGNYSTLYQDIAKDIFPEHDGIYFCTDNK